jgi:hypothetical protein
VLTVSESSKRDILRFVDTQPDKIDVIYNAYDERFGVEPREEDVVRVRERFNCMTSSCSTPATSSRTRTSNG